MAISASVERPRMLLSSANIKSGFFYLDNTYFYKPMYSIFICLFQTKQLIFRESHCVYERRWRVNGSQQTRCSGFKNKKCNTMRTLHSRRFPPCGISAWRAEQAA